MRPTTLSRFRVSKTTKLFKSVYGHRPTNIHFVKLIGTEEAIFKVISETEQMFVVFHNNDLMSYADSLDYYLTEEEIYELTS